MIVAQELANDSPRVSVTENDDRVETFPAQGPDYSLHVRRLPGTSFQCSQDRDKRIQKKRSNFRIFGRRCRRFKMLSCWRSARFSSASSERSGKVVGIRESRRRIIRIMTGKCQAMKQGRSTVSMRPGFWRSTGRQVWIWHTIKGLLLVVCKKVATFGRVMCTIGTYNLVDHRQGPMPRGESPLQSEMVQGTLDMLIL